MCHVAEFTIGAHPHTKTRGARVRVRRAGILKGDTGKIESAAEKKALPVTDRRSSATTKGPGPPQADHGRLAVRDDHGPRGAAADLLEDSCINPRLRRPAALPSLLLLLQRCDRQHRRCSGRARPDLRCVAGCQITLPLLPFTPQLNMHKK